MYNIYIHTVYYVCVAVLKKKSAEFGRSRGRVPQHQHGLGVLQTCADIPHPFLLQLTISCKQHAEGL